MLVMLLFFFFCMYLFIPHTGKIFIVIRFVLLFVLPTKKWTLAPVVTDPLCRRRGRERERRGETRRDNDDDAGVCKNLIEAVNN